MIFGMGPTEFALLVVFLLVPLLFVWRAVLKESPVPEQPTPQQANLFKRIWWLYSQAFRNYAAVNGRASVREFWTFTLVNALISNALDAFDSALGLPSAQDTGLFGIIFAFLMFIPSIAVTARRLHDTGRSGWWMLIVVIPILGWIISFYQLVSAGQPGENRFGSDPREAVAESSVQVDVGESA